jgi:hypothetical protein
MLTYQTRENEIIRGRTPKDVVYRMMKQDFVVTTKLDYMKEVRERLLELDLVEIRIDSHEVFLSELERLGYLTKMNEV